MEVFQTRLPPSEETYVKPLKIIGKWIIYLLEKTYALWVYTMVIG